MEIYLFLMILLIIIRQINYIYVDLMIMMKSMSIDMSFFQNPFISLCQEENCWMKGNGEL